MKNYTGKIIPLAFPDTFVRFSDEKHAVNALQWLGFGKNGVIKAGHAAFVLIENATGRAEYYDFGRYITPEGKGRVRSAVTDVELEIPFTATFTPDGQLANTEAFLTWLEAHPEKTHGDGRLVASVCDYIDYQKAKAYVTSVQQLGSIPYSTFRKEGSNCSRIVTDTILASTDVAAIRRPLLRNKLFTPSPLGNVEKAARGNPMYQVANGEVIMYPNSVFRENLVNYFDKNAAIPAPKVYDVSHLSDAHFLSGIGSGAYFQLGATAEGLFEITRYTVSGVVDFKGMFTTCAEFDISKPYRFVYDSNCSYCHVVQEGVTIRFDSIE